MPSPPAESCLPDWFAGGGWRHGDGPVPPGLACAPGAGAGRSTADLRRSLAAGSAADLPAIHGGRDAPAGSVGLTRPENLWGPTVILALARGLPGDGQGRPWSWLPVVGCGGPGREWLAASRARGG